MKRAFIYIVITLIFSTILDAQVNSNSYVKKMGGVKTIPNMTINTFLDSSDYYININRDTSFVFLEKAYLLSLKSNEKSQKRKVIRKLGDFYAHFQQPNLAAQNYERSLLDGPQDDDYFFNNVLKASKQYLLANNPEKSIEIIDHYYALSNSALQQMFMDISKGDAYLQMEINDKALKEYGQAETVSSILGLTDENTNIKLKIAKILTENDNKAALELLKQAKLQSYQNANTSLQIKSETEIANFYKINHQPELEIASRKIIINTLDSHRLQLDSLHIDVIGTKLEERVNLAKTYNSLGKFDNTIEVLKSTNDLSIRPREKANKPIEAIQNQKTIELKIEAAKALSTAYIMKGQKQKAINSFKKYVELSEKLIKQKEIENIDINQANNKLHDFQLQIDFLEKDKLLYDSEIKSIEESRQLQSDKSRFQLWFIAMLTLIILLLAAALLMMRSRSILQKKHNLMLDLKARRAQMNPHFIFNALNSINSFIAKNDERNANKYLSRFAKLMRSVLENSESDFISLKSEIEILELYMELEKMRFNDKFDYEIQVENSLKQNDFRIPPMLIQPFVENAVWHGLRYKENNGILRVIMEKSSGFMKITIEDNGIGMKKSLELKTKNQSLKKSQGIENTRERLKILSQIYKQDFGYKISDVLKNGEGVKVELWIPNITETDKTWK